MAQFHQKIKKHLLPHFFVDREFARQFGTKSTHHSAHQLSIANLFLYLQVLVIATVGFWAVERTVPQILGTAAFSAQQIVELTNQKRAEYNLAPLTLNNELTQAAGNKARDMFTNDYWAHNSPAGKTPWSFITTSGYRYIFAGENLARDFGDAASVVRAWMNSPSHRANLLDSNFREIGVSAQSGKLGDREGTLVVQMFGTRGDLGVLAQATTQPTISTEPTSPIDPALRGTITEQATVLASSKFALAKIISFAIVGFIFSLLLAEAAVTTKRADLEVKSSIFAHLAILGFVLLAVWYAVSGAII